jgi:nitric oxide dioxygenase
MIANESLKTHCEELSLFLIEIEAYRKARFKRTKRKIVQAIEEDYIEEDSPMQINVSAELVQNFHDQKHDLPYDLFDEMEDEVGKLLEQGVYKNIVDDLKRNLRSSWAIVLERVTPEQAGMLFYENLFTIAPNVRELFPHDMRKQSGKLMYMVNSLLQMLDDVNKISRSAASLGARHHDYGAREFHFDAVKQALVQTLAAALGDDFTDDVKRDWAIVFQTLKDLMTVSSKGRVVVRRAKKGDYRRPGGIWAVLCCSSMCKRPSNRLGPET